MRLSLLLFSLSMLILGCTPQASDDAPAMARGQAIYEQQCASCHGVQGEGAEGWQELNPDGSYRAPPHNDTGHTWHHPDEQLYLIVRDGGRAPGSAMPAFGTQLSHEEIIAVLEYIKTFWSTEIRDSQARASERMPYPPEAGN